MGHIQERNHTDIYMPTQMNEPQKKRKTLMARLDETARKYDPLGPLPSAYKRMRGYQRALGPYRGEPRIYPPTWEPSDECKAILAKGSRE